MSMAPYFENPILMKEIYRLYREFFDKAEKNRRWRIREDIPWDQCNPSLNPAFAQIVESFCTVELFLPDYVGKILPVVRSSRGRAWFTFTWGYEESKHSLALGDWLLKSGHRTEEQMTDLEDLVVKHEWNLPKGDIRGMVCYSMVQELATWLNYRNLRQALGPTSDPALYRLLGYIAVDERAHYTFFRRVLELHLQEDRAGTLEQMRQVMNQFQMPVLHMLADSRQRVEAVKALGIFDDEMFFYQVYLPVLEELKIDRREMRRRTAREVSTK